MAKAPTRALSDRIEPKVREAIEAMENKQIRLAKQPFKASELLELFVEPEHHDALTKAYELCEPSGHTQDLWYRHEIPREYGGGSAYLRFHWHGLDTPHAFYVPYRKGSSMDTPAAINESAPEELVARLQQTMDDLITIRHSFAAVHRVLGLLNRNCSTLPQMRYHWPCIVPLLRKAKFEAHAESVAEPNIRASNAMILPSTRALLGPTNMTIANHQLIDDLPDPPAPPISYEIRETAFKRS